MTEHVSKIYASVTNYNALPLISPLLPRRLRTGLVMCLPFGGERPSLERVLFFSFFFKAPLFCLLFIFFPPSSLHINVSLHFTSAETGGCNPSEATLEFFSFFFFLFFCDSLRGDMKSILEFHLSESRQMDRLGRRWMVGGEGGRGGWKLFYSSTLNRGEPGGFGSRGL